MKKMHIIKMTVWCCLAALIGSSCSNWLDVKPKTEEEAEQLFKDEEGFKAALAGVYIALTQPSLYGRELTYGMVGVLGQEWSSGATLDNSYTAYSYLLKYDELEGTTVKPMIDAVWTGMYTAIANVNTLIEYTDLHKEVFTGDNYEIIRGEALALRAFIHFDLLRFYAPYNFTEGAPVALPYVKEARPAVAPQLNPLKFVSLVLEDIDEALELLKRDPIFTGQDVSGIDNGYLANRNFHLNYYAVLGLKARVALYAGMTDIALPAAREVIKAQEGGLFPWVSTDDLTTANTNLRDRTFSTEHLFAFNIAKLDEYIQSYFKGTNTPLLNRVWVENIDDYRNYIYQADGAVPKVLAKFWQMESQYVSGIGLVRPKRDRLPSLRIAEMYYIAAECLKDSDAQEALAMLNEVRVHRGLFKLTGSDMLQAEIQAEYELELVGEGQMFFYHKRKGTKQIAPKAAEAVYVFAMPDDEIDLGQRN